MAETLVGLISDTHGVFDDVSSRGSVAAGLPGRQARLRAWSARAHQLGAPLVQTVAAAFEGVCAIVHAGDVGHHGGVQGVHLREEKMPSCLPAPSRAWR